MTPNQKAALKQALETHSLGMVTKSMPPEELQQLPEGYQVPTYTPNVSPLYDNQLFPKITSAEDLINIGYATPDGRSTQSGQMAIALKKAGALNDDYTLNDTGKAMMANPADLLEEENLPLYLKSKELDLDGSGRELSWGETFGRFYKESKDSVKALYNIASGPAPTTKEEKAAFDLEVQAGLGGAVKAGAALAMGVAEIAGSGLIKALSDTEAEEDLALASLNQKFEKLGYQFKNAKAAEVIDGLGEMVGAELGVGEAREQNIQTVGEEKAKELEQRGESAGAFASMFNPYGPAAMTGKVAFGVAGKGLGAAFKPISRSLLQADIKAAQVLDKTKQLAALQRQASGLQVATQAAEKKAVFAESMAQRLSQAGLVDRANNALRIANQFRTTGQEAATRLGGFTDEIAAVSDDLAKATQSANVADKVLQVTQKARQIPYLPITALGKTLEATGRGMIGIDKGLSSLASKVGADKAYNAMNKITSLSGLGGAGAALGLGPAAFIPAAIRATWSTAPFIKATGEYISLVGKEATKARGQIGFWKRIYEMPNKGPAHRAVSGLMDTATMGGRIPGAVSNVAKGLVASYPVDLAYEWVSEGGDFNPNILKQAAVETLFFGGTGAALGGITMGGANRIKTLQNGDALNFYRSISDPSQRVMYNGMPSDMKRVIGTFSASNPGAKIQFVDQGAGAYDRNTKTVMVNPNAANPLKPLLTHEFMHHMLNNGIGDGVVAQLVGDGFQTGGLLRGRDGSYDPQYEAFKDEYVNRLRSQHERTVKMRDAIGDPMTKSEREFQTPDEKYLAEEYFIEVNVDDMLGMAESGKLGGIAGRMIINDKARALGDAILNKSAILRDLHFRIGGVMDNKGKMVTGNGFLSGKLYQSPEVRRMFQKMVNESVGRKGGIDAAKRKARNGIEIPVTGKNDPILGEVSSLWETDADGNPYLDASGEYIPLKKETDELRSQAGMLLVDDLKARQARGEVIPDGELSYNPDNNTWSGQYLNDRQIELLNLSGRFNSKQIKQLKLLNAAARDTSNTTADPASRGHRFSVIYQPALKKNRKGQWRYDQIKPQLRDVVPYGVEISKDGNILIRVMSTNQLFANASEKSASKRGRALYDGNMETILRDVNAVIDSHGKNQPTDAYFKDKYGGQWEQHKSFINSVFGNVGAGQKDINPLVATDRVDAVVKSYRLDRMNKATQLVGSTQLPYQNNLVKINYLPEGEPIMDANGEPKDLRYTPSYEAVSQVRMPEQTRQMPESIDADYMKAVESGDVEAQQRMVDDAAKKAGLIGGFYHGTIRPKFNTFENSGDPVNDYGRFGRGFYFTKDKRTAAIYAGKNPFSSGDFDTPEGSTIFSVYLNIKNPKVVDASDTTMPETREEADLAAQEIIDEGYDGVIGTVVGKIDSPNTEYVVFDPSQIKSADPITRDDSGNVIPLSQRFNEKSSDIRYMPEPVSAESGKPMDLMAYTSLGGNPDMIMSAKWGRTEAAVNPKTGKKQAGQTSAIVANSTNPEDHQIGFKRIDALLKAPDLALTQKKKLEDFVIRTAGFAVDSPGFRDIPAPKTLDDAKDVIAKVKDRMAKNLLSIYDAVPTPVKNYWQRWYPLAYDWNNAQSVIHKIPAPAIAGINARLSPGKDWIHNVNMTERILTAFSNKISMTEEIANGAGPILDEALREKLKSKDNKAKSQEWKDEQARKNELAKKQIRSTIGMNIENMTPKQAARLIRFHSQVVGENRVFNYFEKGNPVYADAISWQSFVNLEKSINIYRNPTIENISANMGGDHKIRSFYNNQIAPHDPVLRDVTSDTHAVAATYLLPLSQKSLQVSRNFEIFRPMIKWPHIKTSSFRRRIHHPLLRFDVATIHCLHVVSV